MTNRREFLAGGLLTALAVPKLDLSTWMIKGGNLHETDHDSWSFLRNLFPLNHEKTYLNNGTMGITPFPVLKAVRDSFEQIALNGVYPPEKDDLKKAIAEVVGCDSNEIAITKNVSEAINIGAWGLPLKRGDEILLTTHEHVGGCFPWMQRAKKDGIVLKAVPLGNTAAETLQIISDSISGKTRVISVPHIPCTI